MKSEWLIAGVRYVLGTIMIAYGLIKIFDTQYRMSLEVYEIQLKEVGGVTLICAFMGFSRWFTIVNGMPELILGILLFNR